SDSIQFLNISRRHFIQVSNRAKRNEYGPIPAFTCIHFHESRIQKTAQQTIFLPGNLETAWRHAHWRRSRQHLISENIRSENVIIAVAQRFSFQDSALIWRDPPPAIGYEALAFRSAEGHVQHVI